MLLDFLSHFFIPRHSNNHRAKLLHHSSLLSVVLFLLVLQIFLVSIQNNFSNVLGTTTDISAQEILVLTNKDREQAGLPDLVLNNQLTRAAESKATDMFAKDYWAHNAPDGTTPWVFIKSAGYNYVYAGENLARGFSTSEDVVSAWMASPSHRENMLSPNYRDIGFAVEDGKLLGENTTLVVEEFGNLTTEIAAAKPPQEPVVQNPNVQSAQSQNPSVVHIPLVDSNSLVWNMSFIVLSLFITVLLIDLIVVDRKKIIRFVGHNADHIFYLASLLFFLFLFHKGVI